MRLGVDISRDGLHWYYYIRADIFSIYFRFNEIVFYRFTKTENGFLNKRWSYKPFRPLRYETLNG